MTAMQPEIDFAGWVASQVASLRKPGFQVADELTARVLVELDNRGRSNRKWCWWGRSHGWRG